VQLELEVSIFKPGDVGNLFCRGKLPSCQYAVRVSSRWVLDGGQIHKVTMDSGEATPAYQLVIGDDHPPEGGLTRGTAQSTSEGVQTKVKGRGWKAKPYCQNTWSTRQDGQRRLEVCIYHVSWPAQHTTSVTPPTASARNDPVLIAVPSLSQGAPQQGCEHPRFQACISDR
jgi:hypothetical protein